MKNFQNALALISGGSSGIGLALGKKLASLGSNVAILARRPDRLQTAVDEIERARNNSDQKIIPLCADVSNERLINDSLAKLVMEHGTPDILINSAGVSRPGKFEELPLDIFRQMMEINYLGTVYTTRALIQGMIQRGSGHIVNISSIVGFISIYGYSAYGPSKYAVRAFSDTIRGELKLHGIQVSIAFPPDTDTPQLHEENLFKPMITKEISGNAGMLSPDVVAKAIVDGIIKNRYLIIPGFEGKAIYLLNNLLGELIYPVMDMIIAKAAGSKKS